MSDNASVGARGEEEICRLVRCPNCGKKLMRLPKNYPLYDLQCTACSFRAQVKTQNTKPKNEIFGAGWDILDKVLKSGFMVPPLIVNFRYVEDGKLHRKIVFYPFIPKDHLKKRQLSESARRANYKMYNYVRMREVPSTILYAK